jgi:hypothetical protein
MGIRICAHCKGPLSLYASKKAKYCGKFECKAVRKSISDKKRYPRKLKFCAVCECDITSLWPKNICTKQSCIDTYKEKRKLIVSKKSARYYKKYKRKERKRCEICKKVIPRDVHGTSKTCGREKCVKERARIVRVKKKLRYAIRMRKEEVREKEQLKAKEKKKQKVVTLRKPLIFDKRHDDYFDNDMFIAGQKELEKKNGRYCKKCGKALTGNFYNVCPTCVPNVTRLADGISDSWLFNV